jgi:multidrug transporter EmrE-like cation transporter
MSLSVVQLVALVCYALGMTAGQILFKLAAGASRYAPPTDVFSSVLALILNPFFAASLILYLVLSVCWVWLLTFVPISKAYPFVGISFGGTSIVGWMFFGERLTTTNLFGLAMLGAGVALLAR